MAAFHDPRHNSFSDSRISCSYAPLLDASAAAIPPDEAAPRKKRRRRASTVILLVISGLLGVSLVAAMTVRNGIVKKNKGIIGSRSPEKVVQTGRGVAEGVSRKSFFGGLRGAPPYPWSNSMLAWQRTAFHFQPKNNWMNGPFFTEANKGLLLGVARFRILGCINGDLLSSDPNGPVFYNGLYHFFYQYNPYGAVWGNIAWGHAVSPDLIHWYHLPVAMDPDQWYDANGVWTGSATVLSDGRLVMLYTGSTNESVQVQNLAYPADPSDPLLLRWEKYPGNPVLLPPPGISPTDFRDPTTAWRTPGGSWQLTIGSMVNGTGMSLVYDTEDFTSFKLRKSSLHEVPGTGMWECVDFYPVSRVDGNGMGTSENGPEVKHVVKTSLDDERNDYYAIGTYDAESGTWSPDEAAIDVGIGMRYDYGIFYASKTFYDEDKKRRVLWGWVKETDSEATDVRKGWASLQAIPRTVLLDRKTGSNLLLWPVEEVDSLRQDKNTFDKIEAKSGSVVSLNIDRSSSQDELFKPKGVFGTALLTVF